MITIDLETRSQCDIRTSGAWRYSVDPSTQVLCLAYKIDNGPTKIWVPPKTALPFVFNIKATHKSLIGHFSPYKGSEYKAWGKKKLEEHHANAEPFEFPKDGKFKKLIIKRVARRGWNWQGTLIEPIWARLPIKSKPDFLDVMDEHEIEAHNVFFEKAIWRNICVPLYGFPDIPNDRWVCSAAQVAMHSLPRALGDAGEALGLSQVKDDEGKLVMLQLSKPTASGKYYNDPERFTKLFAYCVDDVSSEYELSQNTRPIPRREREIWLLDQTINERGIPFNVQMVSKAKSIVEDYTAHLERELYKATNGKLTSVRQIQALQHWLEENGVVVDNVRKETINTLLEDDTLPYKCKDVLEIRQSLSKSSTAKLNKILDYVDPRDNRARDLFMYHGAGTGRWGGRGPQPQNLPRGTIKCTDEVFEAIATGDWCEVEKHGNVMDVISSSLRGMIAAPEGKKFYVADFSNIEGRVTAWLAGETWKIKAFSDYDKGVGPDIYKLTYSESFGKPLEDVTDNDRQIGKVQELACIAEDELVLTDKGLVPIQKVTTDMKVWDGVDFVSHEGVIFKGERETIYYDGLRATEDHQVFTEEGLLLSFGECRRKSIPLQKTGFGWATIRVGKSGKSRSTLARWFGQKRPQSQSEAFTRQMCAMRKFKMDSYGELIKGKNFRVSEVQSTPKSSHMVVQKNDSGEGKMHQPERRWFQKLWGAGDRVSFFFYKRGLSVGDRKLRRLGESIFGTRSNRQRRPLRAWKLTLRNPFATVSEPKKVSFIGRFLENAKMAVLKVHRLPKIASRKEPTRDSKRGCRGCLSEKKELEKHPKKAKRVRVYDILNAGPRNRFTVSDCLVHNCGFSGWVGAFQSMARIYGVEVSEKEAADLASRWRKAHPNVVKVWDVLMGAAMNTVHTGATHQATDYVRYAMDGDFLRCVLPSGRYLSYYNPKIKMVPHRFKPNTKDRQLTYMGVNGVTRKWERQDMWRGQKIENVVQAIARDVLCEAMLNIEAAGFPIIMHVHDEIVCEVDEDDTRFPLFLELMSAVPKWAEGLPVSVEGEEMFLYKK